jgi:hypothetical protein
MKKRKKNENDEETTSLVNLHQCPPSWSYPSLVSTQMSFKKICPVHFYIKKVFLELGTENSQTDKITQEEII